VTERRPPRPSDGQVPHRLMDDIHSERYVKGLFAEMARTYGVVNLVSSLGFAWWWRRQAVHGLPRDATAVADLMTGGAECLRHLRSHLGPAVRVDLVDWCDAMCERARHTASRLHPGGCQVVNASALELPAGDRSYDAISSTFGLKTLAEHEVPALAREIRRVLKPGGSFSLLEFSVPPNRLLRFFFRLYVRYYVPALGWIALGNPDHYRLLWKYTSEFGSCGRYLDAFRDAGLEVELRRHFFGCATRLVGRAP